MAGIILINHWLRFSASARAVR